MMPGALARRWLWIAALLLALSSAAGAGDARARVAVVDFTSSAGVPWPGPAVAESLRHRLSLAKGVTVLPREESEEARANPAAFGRAYVVGGSAKTNAAGGAAIVQLVARVRTLGGARLNGRAGFAESGSLDTLAVLEGRLLAFVAAAIGIAADDEVLKEAEAENLQARRLFGEGLIELRKAEGLLREAKAGAITPSIRTRTEGLLKRAQRKLRRAQERNGATFYASAHRNEARARELVASVQSTGAEAQRTRQDTVRLFKEDATRSPVALYDLAQALQLNEQ
jgi:hypothetical protein